MSGQGISRFTKVVNLMDEDTQKRYNPLFEDDCSKRKVESERSAEQMLTAGGKLTESQSTKFMEYAISTKPLREKVTISIKCLRCNAWIRDSWWSRFVHWLVCWLRR